MKRTNKRMLISVLLSFMLLLTGCGGIENAEETMENVGQNMEILPEPMPSVAPAGTPSPEPEDGEKTQEYEGELTTKTVIPNENNIKTLGRTEWVDDTLWMVLPGTGAEFTFVGTKLELTLQADDGIYLGEVNKQARIAIYVNDEWVIDDMVDNLEGTYQVFESEEIQECKVKVVKLSEAGYSSVGLKSMELTSIGDIRPTEPREYFIEFVGDSLTCGYGVEDDMVDHAFSTETENVLKAYACKAAEKLHADYSIVAYSGYGVISGYTGLEEKAEGQLLPDIYSKLGLTDVTYLGRNAGEITWDFSRRQPDLVVINLGSNDDSYTLENPQKQAEFATGYADFLKEIRVCNPDAAILCTLGILGDRLFPSVETAVANYQAETGDKNIYTMKFESYVERDGAMLGGHPGEISYEKNAAELVTKIREIMGW